MQNANVKKKTGNFVSTRTIVMIAMLAAIGYGLSWLEFAVFPAVPFLKLDFSNLATLLGGYLFGPISAMVIEAVKQLLNFVTKSSSGGVGEIANFLMTAAFVLVPSILYRFKKGLHWVVFGMSVGCVLQIAAALLCNRFITFPLFMPDSAVETFNGVWPFIIAFNAIKSVSVSILSLLLYKRLSMAMKWAFGERKSLAKKSAAVYNGTMQNMTITESADETAALAEKFASGLVGGEVILLSGDLGAGKTVFAKGVAKALGVTGEVKSPTFTLCCEYDGRLRLVHIDAYRLKNGAEAEACGLNEKFGDKTAVCLIEWPSQIASVLPQNTIKINIDRVSDNQRKITINADK